MPIIEKVLGCTLNERIQMETLCMVYKSINRLTPTYLAEMFSILSDKCKREFRNTKMD